MNKYIHTRERRRFQRFANEGEERETACDKWVANPRAAASAQLEYKLVAAAAGQCRRRGVSLFELNCIKNSPVHAPCVRER